MLPGYVSRRILMLMEQYGPETVMKAAEIAAGEWRKEPGDQLTAAIEKAECALKKVRLAGKDEKLLMSAVDELDRAAYALRCVACATRRKEVV
ncbi:hypothetical protein [Desulfotomaculum copahuensis]|nr:hypothetical protein [Desulfotomaculum copahuensis]